MLPRPPWGLFCCLCVPCHHCSSLAKTFSFNYCISEIFVPWWRHWRDSLLSLAIRTCVLFLQSPPAICTEALTHTPLWQNEPFSTGERLRFIKQGNPLSVLVRSITTQAWGHKSTHRSQFPVLPRSYSRGSRKVSSPEQCNLFHAGWQSYSGFLWLKALLFSICFQSAFMVRNYFSHYNHCFSSEDTSQLRNDFERALPYFTNQLAWWHNSCYKSQGRCLTGAF